MKNIRKLAVTSATARLTLLAGMLLVAGSSALRAQESGIAMGAMAPAAAVVTLDGMAVDLHTFYGGKPVVLEFWATWCPLCTKLEPAMQEARTKYKDQVTFVSVGVNQNQSAARQKAHVEKHAMDGEFVFDQDGAATKAFSVPHTSYVVVLDASGKVVYTGVGAEQDIDAAVRQGLAASKPMTPDMHR